LPKVLFGSTLIEFGTDENQLSADWFRAKKQCSKIKITAYV